MVIDAMRLRSKIPRRRTIAHLMGLVLIIAIVLAIGRFVLTTAVGFYGALLLGLVLVTIAFVAPLTLGVATVVALVVRWLFVTWPETGTYHQSVDDHSNRHRPADA
jgi:hypothetical protein